MKAWSRCVWLMSGVGNLAAETVVLPVTVSSALPAGSIPMDVEVDFAAVTRQTKAPGVT